MKKALLISVGGTKEPLISSLNEHRPDFVYFLASRESEKVITEILNEFSSLKTFKTYIVSNPDDLNACYEEAMKAYKNWKDAGGEKIVVDYTGGTKTMSVALAFLAALKGLDIYFMSGHRKDAVKVVSGTQFPKKINPWSIYWQMKISEIKNLFEMGLYVSAKEATKELERSYFLPEKENEIDRIKKLCNAFNAWDKFDHQSALNILEEFRNDYLDEIMFLERLLGKRRDKTGYEKVFDLIANAQRRARLERYDDAIARLYRALEMSAQLRLSLEYQVDTADIDLNNPKLTPQARDFLSSLFLNKKPEKIQIPLRKSYELLYHLNDPFGKVFKKKESRFNNFLKWRNFSILAHGEQVVEMKDFEKAFQFTLIFIEGCLKSIGINIDKEEILFSSFFRLKIE